MSPPAAQFHTSYSALKETLLHELAHWAAFRVHGAHGALGVSEVATGGHGDFWRAHVARIQTVFGDFAGWRCGGIDLVKRRVGAERCRVVRLETPVYLEAYACGACGHRVRYASRGVAAQRVCCACGHCGLEHLGRVRSLLDPAPEPCSSSCNPLYPSVAIRVHELRRHLPPSHPALSFSLSFSPSLRKYLTPASCACKLLFCPRAFQSSPHERDARAAGRSRKAHPCPAQRQRRGIFSSRSSSSASESRCCRKDMRSRQR